MRCSACSTENAAENRFCEGCGARLVVPCRKCGHQNSPASHFCGSCGISLEPQSDLPRVVWQHADEERKYATVLFADIVGSTELIAGLDPEQAMERLRPAVATMCDVIRRFDGTVMRTLGDGVMALFGAPRAQEGHAFLACEAALAMQGAFQPREGPAREGPAREGLPTPRESRVTLRVGLHSGEVVSDAPVTDLTKERGVHGATIHLASRLQQMADPGGICLTEDCYRLVRSYFDVRPLGQHALKGFAEPIVIYGLLGLKPAVASQQFRGTNLTSFRGRDRELGILQRVLWNSNNGDTSVIGISGAPGTGKSRLCYEFAEWCRGRLVPVLEARALLYGAATPFQPILEFLRLFFRILPTDDAAVARSRIAERLFEFGRTFEADLPLLYDFLGVPNDESLALRIHPKARHARLLDIIRHMIRQSGSATSVIIVEDLHWLDEASEDFVATLVNAVAGTRTVLVLNYRPSYTAPWMKWSYYQQLSLAELGPAETEALVEGLIGDRPDSRDIRQRVAERSGGNPFFVEELVRSLVENCALLGDPGNYTPGMKTGEGALPTTVQAVIGARIDRLGEAEKTILQIGAIIGKEFPMMVLEDVAGAPAKEIEAVLDRLCDAELIQSQPGIDGRWYAIRHPLIQEVAYVTQLKARRSGLHASVARAMERYYNDRLDEFSGLLAYHFEAAGQALDAANYAARAAWWVGSTNTAQAIKHWQKVRLLLQDQPRSQANDALRIMASSQIAWLGWREGMTAEAAKPLLEEALAWARETDNTMIPMLLFVDARITAASGGAADAYVKCVKEALSLVKEGTGIGRVATLNASLSQAYGWGGLLNEALASNDAALQKVSGIEKADHQFLGYSVEHWILSLRGRILIRLGRFAEGEQYLKLMLQLDQALLDPTVQFISPWGYVDLAGCRGDAPLAEQHALRVAEIAEKHGSPYLRVFALYCAGTAKYLAEDFGGAVADFSESLNFARKVKAALEYEPEILASLADCYHRAGDPERAESIAQEAIEVARRRSARLPQCRASITYGAAVLAKHGAAGLREAEDLFRRAEQLIQESGAWIYEPMLTRERSRMSTLVG
jgi:class 3 adenylate cyclase/tetratricopeptide (TPR) repeat protein